MGNDIIFGDHGVIEQTAGTNRLLTTGSITVVRTVRPDDGGTDVLSGNAGSDTILGGFGGDTINGDDATNVGAAADVLIGDSGRADFVLDGNLTTLDLVQTTDATPGGTDTIHGNNDTDLILGGFDGDTITGDDGNDVIVGDNGSITLSSGAVASVTTTDSTSATGGADTINGNADNDLIIGGVGGDVLYGDAGLDTLLGDNANVTFASGLISVLTTQDDALGGSDKLFGNDGQDVLIGGAGNDMIFGELGNDTIQGDGSIGTVLSPANYGATRGAGGSLDFSADLTLTPSFDAATDGDDYIEAGGGNDVIFGNLGQDDIIGGGSSLFSLTTAAQRPDGADLIFGGSGARIARNDAGDATVNATTGAISPNANGHATDSDVIAGDNANIYRVLTSAGAYAQFAYDQNSAYESRGTLRIVVRVVELLDYTPGSPDYSTAAANDIGVADELHGESGDDFIYGMKGGDALFGDGQDDDLLGGYGNDWISGGSGNDAVLGDHGRIFTSRNGTTEPLYNLPAVPVDQTLDQVVSTPGKVQQATINVSGQLKKSVDLKPFNVQLIIAGQAQDPLFRARNADDIIYGGLGEDSLHGGSGDDAISGAEALPLSYVQVWTKPGSVWMAGVGRSDFNRPFNPGDALRFNASNSVNYDSARRVDEFALYDEYHGMRKIMLDPVTGFATGTTAGVEFFLNFAANEGQLIADATYGSKASDGNDPIFGDLGNDWALGGSGRDDLFGCWGADLLDADDDLSSNSGANDVSDTHPSYEDRAFGGAGRDVLNANTGGDRLIDLAGDFNSYLVPFAPFGLGTVSRALQPQIPEFLSALSASDVRWPDQILPDSALDAGVTKSAVQIMAWFSIYSRAPKGWSAFDDQLVPKRWKLEVFDPASEESSEDFL